MNTQEREQLSQFLRQLTQAGVPHKDDEADALIRDACARQPDAAYLLVQRALLMEQALRDTQDRVARLQGELDTARNAPKSGGFLDSNAWGNAPIRPAAPPPVMQPMPAAPQPAASGWSSGWLGNMATTAAGVVAGSFLFQGIEHLMEGRHGSAPAFASGNDGMLDRLYNEPRETTIVNNYYDSPADSGVSGDITSFDDDSGNSPDWI